VFSRMYKCSARHGATYTLGPGFADAHERDDECV
jgi:hypothetical protein